MQNESAEIVDDEQNDPEFNYLAEAETEELEKDDFRFDKPFRIPRKLYRIWFQLIIIMKFTG